ncbi:transmembrane protein, putative (macronuclear) [Tetrahymena thermophila SB210]|uniref:Transmembrane protein, putative n=1 Tax=Tetrahymena thermophila (strain SB210) TaxID=312017 RepID=Q22NH3_TETTS|nr:transmembrane protein, putative [Tetrahymena thermophila SB210]EAR86812.1 transmembrane protein, putative [Tetrahymena thermophila SB210]|eukprot:XP_001007057.1 transmembrane protein, putative [Tetrahymena thermophila SB210]
MKAFALFAIIALTVVHCDSPSWASQSAAQTFATCITALKTPSCALTTCTNALSTYTTCIGCSGNNGSYSAYLTCVKGCATTFNADSTTTSDTTAAAYVNGYTTCVQGLNGSLLALSAFFLAAFALLF